jgi:hypothetical protein
VNVPDHRQQGLAALDISVEAAARLPEEALDAIAAPSRQPGQPMRSVLSWGA